MYKSGGLLKALLKDPAQRKMAESMLGKAAKGMAVKRYATGGKNDVDPPKVSTAARDELAAFKLQMEEKYGPDGKVSLEDATQYMTLQGAAEREQGYENNQRAEAIQREIDSYNVPNEPTRDTRFNIGYDGQTYDTSRQRVKDNRKINNRAAQDQWFIQEVTGRSYAPGHFMPRTEMERTQKGWELHNARRAGEFMESLPQDVSRWDNYPNPRYAGGGVMKYRMGGGIEGEPVRVPSPYTEVETEKFVKDPPNMGFEYVGQDYLEQFPEKIEDAGKLFRFFTVKEAARLLEDEGITVRGMKPQQILNAARTKGINPVAGARELFDREMEIRKGAGSREYQTDSGFRA